MTHEKAPVANGMRINGSDPLPDVLAWRGPGTGGAGLGGAGGILNDPFAFYYAIYLPNQQLQAMRPPPMDTINDTLVTRQYYAQTDRRGLYNPISPYADQNYDPLHPYSRQQGTERIARPFQFARDPSNLDGTGPSLYYGRASQYFRGLRPGGGVMLTSTREAVPRVPLVTIPDVVAAAAAAGWRHGWHGRYGRRHGRYGRRHGRHGRHDVISERFDFTAKLLSVCVRGAEGNTSWQAGPISSD